MMHSRYSNPFSTLRHGQTDRTTVSVVHRAASTAADSAVSAALLLLFVGSGCAALIYEIVWFQLIQLVIGSSAVSLGVLLGTFMGGMCLGSLLLPRFVSPEQHPLRVYALLEAGIGVLGLVVLVVVPLVGGAYTATSAHGLVGILLRGLVCAVCLLPPTLLMGATLPAIARWVETTPTGVSWLGFFYGSNIAGAVFGCLLAGFYLLRVHDMTTTTFVAAAINFGVAGVGFCLSKRAPHRPAVQARPDGTIAAPPTGTNAVYVAIALSGSSALGAEVVWTRLLSLMLGATVYTFSIILAVFLVGLGIGSSAGSFMARGWRARVRARLEPAAVDARRRVGGVDDRALASLLADQSVAVARARGSRSRSTWCVARGGVSRRRCFGARAFRWRSPRSSDPARTPGRSVGRVYAANTVGAIVGSVLFSVVAIPMLGTQQAQQLLIAIAIVSAIVVFAALRRATERNRRRSATTRSSAHASSGACFGAGLVAAAMLAAWVPKFPTVWSPTGVSFRRTRRSRSTSTSARG